jgi:hypothetical protein
MLIPNLLTVPSIRKPHRYCLELHLLVEVMVYEEYCFIASRGHACKLIALGVSETLFLYKRNLTTVPLLQKLHRYCLKSYLLVELTSLEEYHSTHTVFQKWLCKLLA